MEGILDTGIDAGLAYALQLALGIVFLAAAAPKLRRPGGFVATVAAYRIAPPRLVPALSLGMIAVEAFLAFAFLSGLLMAIALPLAAAALAVYFVAVAVNLRRGRPVPCGCFGDPHEEVSARSLTRVGVLAGALIALVAVAGAAGTEMVTLGSVLSAGADGREHLVEAAAASGLLIVAGMWALSLPELSSVLRGGAAPAAATDPLEPLEPAA